MLFSQVLVALLLPKIISNYTTTTSLHSLPNSLFINHATFRRYTDCNIDSVFKSTVQYILSRTSRDLGSCFQVRPSKDSLENTQFILNF